MSEPATPALLMRNALVSVEDALLASSAAIVKLICGLDPLVSLGLSDSYIEENKTASMNVIHLVGKRLCCAQVSQDEMCTYIEREEIANHYST